MISEKIKELRTQAKMSQESLAEKLNVSRQAITKWETGAGLPDINNIMAIAKLFQISLDELLDHQQGTDHTTDFLYESRTEYDIDERKNYDITFMGAKSVVLKCYEGEKILVRLASNQISNIQNAFKVKLDDVKKRIDVGIRRLDVLSETEAKAALHIFIYVPLPYTGKMELEGNTENLELIGIESDNVEFSGKVKHIEIEKSVSHIEINTNEDLEVICSYMKGRLDINQISATSKLYIDVDTNMQLVTRGIANKIMPEDKQLKIIDDEGDFDLMIELNGIKSELVITGLRRKEA